MCLGKSGKLSSPYLGNQNDNVPGSSGIRKIIFTCRKNFWSHEHALLGPLMDTNSRWEFRLRKKVFTPPPPSPPLAPPPPSWDPPPGNFNKQTDPSPLPVARTPPPLPPSRKKKSEMSTKNYDQIKVSQHNGSDPRAPGRRVMSGMEYGAQLDFTLKLTWPARTSQIAKPSDI